MTLPTYRQVLHLFRQAVHHKNGKRLSLTQAEWDLAGSCEQPRTMDIWARPTQPERTTMSVILHTRCRRCPACLRQRSAHWRDAASIEIARASRTWFGTLTLSPANQQKSLELARRALDRKGGDLDQRPPEAVFAAQCRVAGAWVTTYLKRVRKQSQAPLRYLLVWEAHKSGLPHAHMLLHERDPARPVTKRILDEQWPWGFTKWKLVDDNDSKAAGYICKYLAKSMMTRVRGSIRYGQLLEAEYGLDPNRRCENPDPQPQTTLERIVTDARA